MTRSENEAPRVSLVTRTHTINSGNQALSIVWRDYLAARYPGARVSLFERVPKYLRRYTVSTLAAEPDPIAAFDRIAQTLLGKMPTNGGVDPSVWDVRLDSSKQRGVRFHRLKRVLELRSRIPTLNLGSAAYFNRLRYLTQADLVVVNPAGEFHSLSTDTALLYLLETRCAQLAGCRTAFVNLSFEVQDPALIRLSNHVFSSCDVVEFRDVESKARLQRQVEASQFVVLPDAVILSTISPSQKTDGRGIALVVNGPQVAENCLMGAVREFTAELVNQERVTLTSNEWATDRPYWSRFVDVARVECAGHGLDYDEYARFLAGFDVVISSRLHTCVLGMLAGAIVVPVECGTFKLTGFFNQIGLPNEPIRIGSDEWQAKLTRRLAEVRSNRQTRLALQHEKIQLAVGTLRGGLDKVFSEDLIAHAKAGLGD